MAQAAISPRVEASMWIAEAEAVVVVCADRFDEVVVVMVVFGGGRRERLTPS